ncbi:hypothetical protein GCM10009579_86880 [Streptomyces javensis]|uniref:Uncharacterized protein n=1 Tax=Streptomyces javensis TaxID=114698 RepID=A0ABN1XDZ5_9ACTN
MDLRGVATPGTPSRRTGRKPKYAQYEGFRPARREHAPDAAPSPAKIHQKPPGRPHVNPLPAPGGGTPKEAA